MNKDRRKTLAGIAKEVRSYSTELEALYATANELIGKVNEAISEINDKYNEVKENLASQIDEVKDEEQEYYDNMSENLQGGEKGEIAQEAINQMEEAFNFIEGLEDIDELEELTPVILEEAAECLDNAGNG